MGIRFKIEAVININNGGCYVFACLLDQEKHFELSHQSTLGGLEITTFLDIPRAIDKHGKQRFDFWTFQLKNEADAEQLIEGAIIELITSEN